MPRLPLGRAYRRVLWANTISSVGDGAYVGALLLLAVTVTRDPRLIALVSAPDAVLAGALFAASGYSATMWNVVAVSLRQRIVPGELLGRVNSVYRMINWGLFPFGAVAGGFVAREFGLRAPYVLGGVALAVAVVTAIPALAHARRACLEP